MIKESKRITSDVLQIGQVTPVQENSTPNGGLKDMGALSEGSCLEIKTTDKVISDMKDFDPANNKTLTFWIVCLNQNNEKGNFLSKLQTLIYSNQRKRSFLFLPSQDSKIDPNNPKDSSNLEKSPIKYDNQVKNGYWKTVSQWSQCSKKCGSGTSTLQRICVPPTNGGNYCDGESIITKTCNEQLCPVDF